MKKLLTYFIQGILYTAPVGLTIYVLYSIFIWVDNIIPFKFPGLGIVVVILLLTFLGFIGNAFFLKPIMSFFDKLLGRTPLAKIIYTSVKDLLGAFVGKEKKFKVPVLITINKENNIEKIGFLTRDDLSLIGIKDKKVAVYCPHSYAFSGEMFIVSADNIKKLDIGTTEAMKFIVSGGVTNG